jgi:hypothetical protein
MRGMRGLVGGRAGLALLAGLAVGVAGCGDSESSGANAPTRGKTASYSGDEVKVVNAITDLRTVYNKQDGAGFCSRLTADGRREIEVLVPKAYTNLKAHDCAGIVTEYSGKVVGGGQPQRPVRVRRIKVDGNKARIVITGGPAGVRRIVPFRYVKTGGKWLLDDPISGTNRVIGVDYSIRLPSVEKHDR